MKYFYNCNPLFFILFKNRLLLLFVLFFGNLLHAQLGFEHHEIVFDTGILSNLARTTVGDIDGDGDMDVIAARFTSYQRHSNIVWYKNLDGLGNYGEMTPVYGDLTGTSDVHVADLDGDGDMDILAVSGDDDNVVWYENLDGLGNFGSQQVIATNAPDAIRVTTGDLDSDGDLDVLVIYLRSLSYDRLVWYKNLDGLGNFGSEQILVEEASVIDMAIVDIDGDNDNDVVYSAATTSRTIGFLRNIDGLGNFGSPGAIAGNSVDYYNSVAMSDVDDDGDFDALYSYNDITAWKENTDGLGTFGTEQIINQSVYSKRVLSPIDVDGDGDIDLIEGSKQQNQISWYENTNGLGAFGAPQVFTTQAYGVQSVVAAYIDGDTDVDIVSASSDSKLVWYSNKDEAGTFGLPISVSKNSISISALDYGDIDLDGDIDLISSSTFDNEVAWYENRDGQGDYKHQHIITNQLNSPKAVILEDVDGDGDLDIICYHTGTHYVFWYENEDGLGRFGPIRTIAEYVQGINNLQVADFDNDGDIDILVQATTEPKLAIYKNDGQGVFGAPIAIATNNFSGVYIHIADLDTDGDLDFFVAQNGALLWFKNVDGQGTFEFQDYISANVNVINAISSGDMDGDGYIDIVIAGTQNTNDKVWWLKNLDGQGNFGSKILVTDDTGGTEVTVADLDSDGDLDVLFDGNYTVAWCENLNGMASFAPAELLALNSPGGSRPIHVADLNGDGTKDVVSGGGFTLNLIGWYANIGSLANIITGKTKFDSQNDGCDINDDNVANVMIITNDGTDDFARFTAPNGIYQMPVTVGNYTTTAGSNFPDYFSVTPNSHVSVFPQGGGSDTADFCISPLATANDLMVSIFPLDIAKPRYYVTYKIVYENVGTTMLTGSVQFAYEDDLMNFTEASPLPVIDGNIFTWDFNDLKPFETKIIEVTFKIADPPIVEVGDILPFSIIVNPIGSDETPEDNVFHFNHLVKNFIFDNRMAVSEDPEVAIEKADEYLHYNIRFKNPGNETVSNLRIEDILDDKLDWKTLKVLGQSHTLETELVNGKVYFLFNDINLSSEPEENEGFVLFKVKPLPIIAANDEIENEANLYFDLLPTITTNTVVTKYVEGLGVSNFDLLKVLVYPNPANNILNIQAEGSITSIEIMNLLGQTLLTSKGNSKREQIDISGLSAGNYFVKVFVGDEAKVLRVVKR